MRRSILVALPRRPTSPRPRLSAAVRGFARLAPGICREPHFRAHNVGRLERSCTGSPFEQWGRFLPQPTTAFSLLDRLLHHAVIVTTEGESYRMKEARAKGGATVRRR